MHEYLSLMMDKKQVSIVWQFWLGSFWNGYNKRKWFSVFWCLYVVFITVAGRCGWKFQLINCTNFSTMQSIILLNSQYGRYEIAIYPVYPCYSSHTVYRVYRCTSCLPMFTLVILYPYVSCLAMFTLVILYTPI